MIALALIIGLLMGIAFGAAGAWVVYEGRRDREDDGPPVQVMTTDKLAQVLGRSYGDAMADRINRATPLYELLKPRPPGAPDVKWWRERRGLDRLAEVDAPPGPEEALRQLHTKVAESLRRPCGCGDREVCNRCALPLGPDRTDPPEAA